MVGNRTNDVKVYCSFCGKSQDEVKKIIAGNNVFICNECVALSQEIIKEELAEEVLEEIPRQIVEYYQHQKISPKEPVVNINVKASSLIN